MSMYWFARDDDGECSVWDGRMKKPRRSRDNGFWINTFRGSLCLGKMYNTLIRLGRCIRPTTTATASMFGPGYHGVRKGQCKLVELERKDK